MLIYKQNFTNLSYNLNNNIQNNEPECSEISNIVPEDGPEGPKHVMVGHKE
jgi:hypothetical protein